MPSADCYLNYNFNYINVVFALNRILNIIKSVILSHMISKDSFFIYVHHDYFYRPLLS